MTTEKRRYIVSVVDAKTGRLAESGGRSLRLETDSLALFVDNPEEEIGEEGKGISLYMLDLLPAWGREETIRELTAGFFMLVRGMTPPEPEGLASVMASIAAETELFFEDAIGPGKAAEAMLYLAEDCAKDAVEGMEGKA